MKKQTVFLNNFARKSTEIAMSDDLSNYLLLHFCVYRKGKYIDRLRQ